MFGGPSIPAPRFAGVGMSCCVALCNRERLAGQDYVCYSNEMENYAVARLQRVQTGGRDGVIIVCLREPSARQGAHSHIAETSSSSLALLITNTPAIASK